MTSVQPRVLDVAVLCTSALAAAGLLLVGGAVVSSGRVGHLVLLVLGLGLTALTVEIWRAGPRAPEARVTALTTLVMLLLIVGGGLWLWIVGGLLAVELVDQNAARAHPAGGGTRSGPRPSGH